jgi:predicted nucleic acid-binding protein
MKISNVAAQRLLDELKVVVTVSTKVIKKVLRVLVNKGEPNEEIIKQESKFWPCSISINNQFNSSDDSTGSEIDPQYAPYIEALRDKVITAYAS